MTTGNEETDQLWDEFHVLANMTSEELRYWLLTDASGENGLPAGAGVGE